MSARFLRSTTVALTFLWCNQYSWADDPSVIEYNRDVRPLFSDRCYTCHGPDAEQRQTDMRLDVRKHAIEVAITPGNSADSELIARVISADADLQMPPPDSNRKPLSDEEVALLRRWIDEGANFTQHWAYTRPVQPDFQSAIEPAAAAVDHFVQKRLVATGLASSQTADPRTLVRRLSFDLTGLPPSPEMVDLFVADPSDDAYRALVEDLLASRSYGERMALYWLDLVRYADTSGIHGDQHRDVWAYRDYVINAFNDNIPFDQFTIEQLAGDLLKEPTREQRIASGYNRLLMTTEEGGAQPKEYTAKYAADRVRNVSSVWLGATMGCAECHDHKFDPYTQRDFYSMGAFFADVQETAVGRQQQSMLLTRGQEHTLKEIQQLLSSQQEKLNTKTPELRTAQARWELEASAHAIRWQVLHAAEVSSDAETSFETLDDGSVQASGPPPDKETYTVTLMAPTSAISALRLEALPDDLAPKNGPGRADNGNFVLSEVSLDVDDKSIPLAAATTGHSQQDHPVESIVDGKPGSGWAILPQTGTRHAVVIRLAEELPAIEADTLTLSLSFQQGGAHTIGRFRVSAADASGLADSKIPVDIRCILGTPVDRRTAEEHAALSAYFRGVTPQLADVRAKVAKLEARVKSINNSRISMLATTSVKPRTMRILSRGDWLDDSGEIVMPAVPSFLGAIECDEGHRLTRLDLANWLVSANNPLTARVMVNRLWMLMFGRGLVDSPDDFGAQGSAPSHNDLLDWLALEFIDSGWDVKHMLRLIVQSRTYRQSSQPSAESTAADPVNNLLSRQNRSRLEAEMIRDNALAVSGLLAADVGGPSVKPYQPKGYWAHLNFPKRTWQHDSGPSQHRRGLYTYWCRTFLHPSLLAFDASTREECAVQRPQSNTPLQALVLLNDPTHAESARVLAEHTLRNGGEEWETQLRYAFRRALQREPRDKELSILQSLYDKHLAEYAGEPKDGLNIISAGQAAVAGDLDQAQLAAWTSVTRVLLNLHESIARY